MNEQVAMLVWEEARRLLVQQHTDLDSLRARAATVLGAAVVVAGLFLGQLPEELSTVAAAAIVVGFAAFALAAVVTLWIEWPTTFTFNHRLDEWLADLEAGRDVAVLDWAFNLARDFETWRLENQTKIDDRYNAFSAVIALVGIQVVAWGIAAL